MNAENLSIFQKDILRQEIELIDRAIARIDHIQLSLKNWSVVIWGGSLYLVTKDLDLPGVIVMMTALIPVMFGILDLIWTRQLLIVGYRQEKIAEFINGNSDTEKQFYLLDPIAKRHVVEIKFRESTRYRRALGHKGIVFFYMSLAVVSLILGICLW
jgi:hypothetical protein